MERLYLDYTKCIGCRLCELACSAEKEGVYNPNKARIRSERIGLPEQVIVTYCHQCDNPKCIENCPVNAIARNEKGVVVINEAECIGCGNCVKDCPIGAIFMKADVDIPVKCDLCGGEPKCVDICPRGALVYGDYPEGELLSNCDILKKLLEDKGMEYDRFKVSQED